jgi:hypothetical protein
VELSNRETDAELLAAAGSDPEAFGRFYDRYEAASRATWQGAAGQVIASVGADAQTRQAAANPPVNATRGRPLAPFLLAHFRLFRSAPADDLAHDPNLPTPGTGMGLNYWQTRYVPSVTGLDGPGLWITPGAKGLCISDPQAGTCGC